MELPSTPGFYHKSELHGSPVVKDRWIPNYNYWEFFIITLIRMNWHNPPK